VACNHQFACTNKCPAYYCHGVIFIINWNYCEMWNWL